MPELPEVETVRRGLAAVLDGRVLTRVEVRRTSLRRPLPEGLAERLCGQRVEGLGRRAKYLLIGLSGGETLIVHLGMSGRMVISPADPGGCDSGLPPGRHDHVVFATGEGVVVTFTDPRRFGAMDLWPSARVDSHPLLAGLGPEPLSAAFGPAVLAAVLGGRRAPVKAVLMDQRRLAGLGNIYACEALYRAGIAPLRPAGSLAEGETAALAAAIRAVLVEAIAAGGASLRDHVQPSGAIGLFQHAFAVYGRTGAPCGGCDCGGRHAVERVVLSGRSTFYCASKQR